MPAGTILEPPGYAPLRRAAAWCELPRRAIVEVTGAEAVTFVDKFATAALGGLQPGQAAETLFTDARGWVLALALVLRREDGLEIDAGHAPRIALDEHLEHYHVRERVEVRGTADRWTSFLVAGPAAADFLTAQRMPSPAAALTHATGTIGPAAVRVVRVDWFADADGFLIRCDLDDEAAVRTWLLDSKLPQASLDAVETLRIEARFPAPIDIPEKTLPQELDRPPRSISFTKGCYLGQETVARLDALGHVNRMLSLVASEGRDPMPAGTPVLVDGVEAGVVTSSCLSPLHAAPLAMSILHHRSRTAGAVITVGGDRARVVPVAIRPEPPFESHSA